MELKADDNQKIGQIIGSIQIGMLTTGLANGELRSRPMLCADFDFDSLWFLIKESQPVLAESMGNCRKRNICQPRERNIRVRDGSGPAGRRRKNGAKALAS